MDSELETLVPELVAFLARVADHFEYTDAPLGIAANALLQKIQARANTGAKTLLFAAPKQQT